MIPGTKWALGDTVASVGQVSQQIKQQFCDLTFTLCQTSENSGLVLICFGVAIVWLVGFYLGSALVAAVVGGSAYDVHQC